MTYIALGCVGFLFFYIFDWNKIRFVHRSLNAFFALGIITLAYATIGLLRTGTVSFTVPLPMRFLFLLFAFLSISLQFYALFFALPFTDTYWNNGEKKKVIIRGIYGMCRHPGVLFFFFFYFFLWLGTGNHLVLVAAVMWTAMDVLHVYVQDRWMFPKSLLHYEMYQQTTPFLLPTRNSLKALQPSEER